MWHCAGRKGKARHKAEIAMEEKWGLAHSAHREHNRPGRGIGRSDRGGVGVQENSLIVV